MIFLKRYVAFLIPLVPNHDQETWWAALQQNAAFGVPWGSIPTVRVQM
jgi:hypothetical protein